MGQIVTLVQWKIAPLLLHGTKTGVIQLPLVGVRLQKAAQKLGDGARVIAHEFLQPGGFGRVVTRRAAQHVRHRPVGNVLVMAEPALLLREKKLPIVLGKTKGDIGKVKNLPLLQPAAIFAGLDIGVCGDPSSGI